MIKRPPQVAHLSVKEFQRWLAYQVKRERKDREIEELYRKEDLLLQKVRLSWQKQKKLERIQKELRKLQRESADLTWKSYGVESHRSKAILERLEGITERMTEFIAKFLKRHKEKRLIEEWD